MKLKIISLILIFIALTLYLWRANVSGYFYGNTDFFKFYESVRFYLSGQSLYSPTIVDGLMANGNLNPPFLTLLILPLYFFNYAVALKIWTVLSILLLLISITLLLKPFAKLEKYSCPIIAAALIYIPNSASFAYGQVTNYILILLVGAWLLAREKKDISAGMLIGLACAIKIFCGLFLIYFLVIKRVKLLISSLITGFIAFITSILVFGWQNYLNYRLVLEKIGWYTASWNVSFTGFFMRLFSTAEKNLALINLPILAESLSIIFSVALIIYLIYAWAKLGDEKKEKFDIGFSLVVISMLLLSPLGWSYYFGLLIIPYLILIRESQNDWVHLLLCITLLFSQLSGALIRTIQIKTVGQIFYNGGIGFYVLIILLILFMRLIKSNTIIVKNNLISENLWVLIYSVIFIPALSSLFFLMRNLAT